MSQVILQNKIQKDDSAFGSLIEGSIKNAIIPNGVSQIKASTFENCYQLESVTIPNSVTKIGDNAFYNCDLLNNVNIPSTVNTIGKSAFASCHSLTSINIPQGVTSIKDSTFNYCYVLSNVTIPNTVTSIGQYVFYGCKILSDITIPSSVTSIGTNAFGFQRDGVFVNLTVLASTPPSIYASAISDLNPNFAVYVPAASVDAYKAANGWSTYADKIQAIPTWSLDI